MFWKHLLLLALSFGLFGCTTKLVYSNIDWIVMEYVDDYVSLNSEQEEVIKLSVQQLSEWHKTQELPTYIEHLDELASMDPKAVDAAYVFKHAEKLRQHAKRVIAKASPNLYALVSQLNQKQIDELLKNTAKNNEEYREKYEDMSESEIREVYQERMEDNLDRWLGTLSKEQKAIIKSWSEKVKITNVDWAAHNDKMYKEIETLLNRRDEVQYFQSTFIRLLDDPDSFYTDSLKQKLAHNRQLSSEQIARVINLMDNKQLAYFKEEIADWRDIAQDLVTAK
ncbi:hypothetical protein HC752_12275 [Vibrio sp. S9_S30]|uniref:DUF6279 family lipoprotein n=1 Tax=Vibrio sp. S9_S30 TaxID=2720226 RepID=UPI001681A649|nr:DUF6279 family lipoprotein [Vibrio sp. S9_S30]MBD1557709.1 hypothetical protein [Vibrio sp. S9_S30]